MKKKTVTMYLIKCLLPATIMCIILLPFMSNPTEAALGPPSLKTIQLPDIPHLNQYVKNKQAAIQLGKALFWDMQVGSDGIQACASCHFHAGADNRIKNSLNPGLRGGDTAFGNNPATGKVDYPQFGPNYTLQPDDFPFHKLKNPNGRNSKILFDTDDIVGPQGVFLNQFINVYTFFAGEKSNFLFDDVFNVYGVNVRQTAPRNVPTMINAAFNFANLWDGRANNIFNGVNPFGAANQKARVLANINGNIIEEIVRLPNSSTASQATGAPLSTAEMSFLGRDFRFIGKKILSLTPLAKQIVHPQDSVLGNFSRARLNFWGRLCGRSGLDISYTTLIQQAFQDKYWNSDQRKLGESTNEELPQPTRVSSNKRTGNRRSNQIRRSGGHYSTTTEFSQMEANFSLFFAVAVMMYERTLIADDTLYDQYQEGKATLNNQQLTGLDIFLGKGKCIQCHAGPEFTDISDTHVAQNGPITRIIMDDGQTAFHDTGFHNIGVRPTAEDIGRGGLDPSGYPLSFSRLAYVKDCGDPPLGMVGLIPELKGDLVDFVPDLPSDDPCALQRTALDGSFKTPGLRNVELTGPYFHNGGQATLHQVIDFFNRGGDFHEANILNLSPDIEYLDLSEEEKDALVAFLLTLTDDRVKFEQAPFDHPQLYIPNGEIGDQDMVIGSGKRLKRLGFSTCDKIREIPAVGQDGRSTPLQPFLEMDPYQ